MDKCTVKMANCSFKSASWTVTMATYSVKQANQSFKVIYCSKMLKFKVTVKKEVACNSASRELNWILNYRCM